MNKINKLNKATGFKIFKRYFKICGTADGNEFRQL